MQVDFNILRKKLIRDYNGLTCSLNGAICTDIDMDRVIIPVNDIKMIMERLRQDIIIISAINDPQIDDCECVINDAAEIKEFSPDN